MRILALDHGSARCGCAISDPTQTLVRPVGAVAKPDSAAGRARIARIVADEDVGRVIVGLPLLAGGEAGAQAAAARSFAGRLSADLDVPVELFDERFTTRMAQASIAAGAASDEDSLAAAHLLEEYLRMKRAEGQER